MQYKENKHEQSKLSGAGTEIAFKIKWHFSKSLPFLADSVTPRLITRILDAEKSMIQTMKIRIQTQLIQSVHQTQYQSTCSPTNCLLYKRKYFF